jgi:transcriptional regulator with XRE-family HTH domain
MTRAGRPDRWWITTLDGQRLRQLRRQRGLSQEKLADRAGISTATVARLERHLYPSCQGRTLGRLAAALGEQPDAIMSLCPASRADSKGLISRAP